MAKTVATLKGQVLSNESISYLQQLVATLERKPVLGGNLRVLGSKKYWWLIEFGTASKRRDRSAYRDTPLVRPLFAQSDGPRSPYLIEPDKRRNARLLAANPKGRGAFLTFPSSKGGWVMVKWVMHPGARAQPFLRMALYKQRRLMEAELKNYWESNLWKQRVTKKGLLEIVNRHLDALLERVRAATPVNRDPDKARKTRSTVDGALGVPLRDSWVVSRAR